MLHISTFIICLIISEFQEALQTDAPTSGIVKWAVLFFLVRLNMLSGDRILFDVGHGLGLELFSGVSGISKKGIELTYVGVEHHVVCPKETTLFAHYVFSPVVCRPHPQCRSQPLDSPG